MRLGVCYYPEQWPRERWAADARWLRELGVDLVRMGELAWSRLELAEGRFAFGWLEDAVELFAGEGFEVVLGTPTAAPPLWLSHADPSTLPVDERGLRRRPGGRHHVCPSSAAFRARARRIVSALAERFADHPAVIGWQLDNELGESDSALCFCDACGAAFAGWLRDRYGSLDQLNDAWGTVFWSAELSDWAQVEPPLLQRNEANPARVLDFRRFQSGQWAALLLEQAELLARPGRFLTHNTMGLFGGVDQFALLAPLDLASWSSYPAGHASRDGPALYAGDPPDGPYAFDAGDPSLTGLAHDLTYGLRRRPFWVMEQGMGHVNWSPDNVLVRDGTPRLWCWHAVACGADAVVFFRERAARHAQEQHHSGLQRHDGTRDVGARDAARVHAERAQLARLTAAPVEAEVALPFSYDDLWALELGPHRPGLGYLRTVLLWYRALQRLGVQAAVVPADAELGGFRAVLAPALHVAGEATGARLHAYVEAGGTLLLGVRAGVKTPENAVVDVPLPGALRPVAGATVGAWGALPDGAGWPLRSDVPGLAGTTRAWSEALVPDGPATRVLAAHGAGPHAGAAALLEHGLGAGRALVCGWLPTLEQAVAILDHALRAAGVARPVDALAPGLVARRRGDALVLLNFADAPLDAVVGGLTVRVGPRDVLLVDVASG